MRMNKPRRKIDPFTLSSGDLEKLTQRRVSANERYRIKRNKAIESLGGVCQSCFIERDVIYLNVMKIGIAKNWSNLLFYERVGEHPDRHTYSKLICNRCLANNKNSQACERRALKGKVGKEDSEFTGEVYWIGGQRVEQRKKRAPGALVRVIHSDLGVEELEVNDP